MEWKFSRSKLWMGYFDEGSTLPSPFNLIISPKSIYYAVSFFKNFLSSCINKSRPFTRSKRRTSISSVKVRNQLMYILLVLQSFILLMSIILFIPFSILCLIHVLAIQYCINESELDKINSTEPILSRM